MPTQIREVATRPRTCSRRRAGGHPEERLDPIESGSEVALLDLENQVG